jgi:mono/diheme cytochrome c family protein
MKSYFYPKKFVLATSLLVAASADIVKAQSGAAEIQPVTSVVRLSQGWSKSESAWFHSTTQGSQFMPYAFYIALEQAGNQQPLNSAANLERLRCITRPATASNPDALPIGFVADDGSTLPKGLLKDNRSLGFTCAACHTAQINYQGKGLLIDGGPTLSDIDALINAVKDSLVATTNDSAKFNRFAAKVLRDEAGNAAKKQQLKVELEKTKAAHLGYAAMNHTQVKYGFARLDAFGRIFNNSLALVKSANRVVPDAPVSFPFLWNTVKADTVQWTGNAKNGALGSLARNVGEVVGVFGAIDSGGKRVPHGYASSVDFKNLRKLEKALHGLDSPAWPTSVLPKIDKVKARAGAALFKTHCSQCHQKINPFSWLPFVDTFKSQLTPLEDSNGHEGVHTDRTAAALIRDSVADSGKLKGERKLFTLRETYAAREPVVVMVEDAVVRVLIGLAEDKRTSKNTVNRVLMQGEGLNEYGDLNELMPRSAEEEVAEAKGGSLKSAPLVYRARPLDGIWATGPFLHNGSVPTLFDLMLPEERRPKTFAVGHREFDPVKVGPVTTPAADTFTFDTRLKGNSNKGHDYGTSKMTDDQRWQLVEYMKTL